MMTSKKLGVCVAALLVVAGLAQAGSAGSRGNGYRERTTELTSGVTYTRIRDAAGPWRIRVVSADLDSQTTFDTVLSNDKLPKLETTSSMAARSGAMVAINGDYARPSGRPVFTFAADGDLAQTPLVWGRNFSVAHGERVSYIGHPEPVVSVTENDGAVYPISAVNNAETPITSTEVRLFTDLGKTDAPPPRDHCLVRMLPLTAPVIKTDGSGVEQSFQADRIKCGGRPLKPLGGAVMAATVDGSYAVPFLSIFPGDEFRLSWSLGWPGVLDTIGGNPTLLEAGQIISKNVDGCGWFCSRHPRTGVGTTPDGRVLLITVDGREKGYSVGMTLREFAQLFSELGADWALNLDGGGSTTMAIGGTVVNRPSDNDADGKPVERAVSSALVLLPGSDTGEAPQPNWTPPPSPAPSPSVSPSTPGLALTTDVRPPMVALPDHNLAVPELGFAAATDPASTGGMLDAMARSGYRIPDALRSVLRVFRHRFEAPASAGKLLY